MQKARLGDGFEGGKMLPDFVHKLPVSVVFGASLHHLNISKLNLKHFVQSRRENKRG